MTTSIEPVKKELRSVDLDRLIQYDNKLHVLEKAFSKMMASVYLKEFIMAIDTVNDMQAKASQAYALADRYLKYVEAKAYFERAPDFLTNNGVKDSVESRKRYVDLDPEVMEALEIRAKTEAIVKFLYNKMQQYRMCHDDIKKVVYGDQFMTQYEGT